MPHRDSVHRVRASLFVRRHFLRGRNQSRSGGGGHHSAENRNDGPQAADARADSRDVPTRPGSEQRRVQGRGSDGHAIGGAQNDPHHGQVSGAPPAAPPLHRLIMLISI